MIRVAFQNQQDIDVAALFGCAGFVLGAWLVLMFQIAQNVLRKAFGGDFPEDDVTGMPAWPSSSRPERGEETF